MKKNLKIKVLKNLGINNFIAVKNKYNKSVNANRFYYMLSNTLNKCNIEEKSLFLKRELSIHYKEYTQYQN
jgi:hypothetical protein